MKKISWLFLISYFIDNNILFISSNYRGKQLSIIPGHVLIDGLLLIENESKSKLITSGSSIREVRQIGKKMKLL